jgi:hypothetical protein
MIIRGRTACAARTGQGGQALLAVGTDPEMADENVRKYGVNLVKNVHHAIATSSKMCMGGRMTSQKCVKTVDSHRKNVA